MADIIIRNIDSVIINKIDEMAKKRKISREEFLRVQLKDLSIAGEIKAVEDKYENLVNVLADVIKANTEEIEKINYKIEKHFEREY